MSELTADQQTFVAQFITDTTAFADTIRWTRNYYTHFGEDEELRIDQGRGRIAEGTALLTYATQLQALLELLFIADLNLPQAAVARVVSRVKRVRVIGA